MTPEDQYHEDVLLWASESDRKIFDEIAARLPLREPETPYHSGHSNVRGMRAALAIFKEYTGHIPENLLETGFCLGHSASIFLTLGVWKVVSVENSQRPQTLDAAARMSEFYHKRFLFVEGDARKDAGSLRFGLDFTHFEMMHVDGGHDFDCVDADVKLGLSLGIKHFLLDDVYTRWGPGVWPAIVANNLVPVAIIGAACYCMTRD